MAVMESNSDLSPVKAGHYSECQEGNEVSFWYFAGNKVRVDFAGKRRGLETDLKSEKRPQENNMLVYSEFALHSCILFTIIILLQLSRSAGKYVVSFMAPGFTLWGSMHENTFSVECAQLWKQNTSARARRNWLRKQRLPSAEGTEHLTPGLFFVFGVRCEFMSVFGAVLLFDVPNSKVQLKLTGFVTYFFGNGNENVAVFSEISVKKREFNCLLESVHVEAGSSSLSLVII